jgi:hypothetical protein
MWIDNSPGTVYVVSWNNRILIHCDRTVSLHSGRISIGPLISTWTRKISSISVTETDRDRESKQEM